jgi:transcriptional regulator GlxA family with amidase domain
MKYANNIWQAGSKPLHVGLLLLDESNMLSLAAAVDPMRACNRRADRRLFSWQFLSQTGAPVHLTSGMAVQTEKLIGFAGDLLILVAGFRLETQCTPPLISALRRQVADGCQLWGVDGGSWIMAQAGLLNGHRATCHWEDAEAFSRRFPAVNLVPDRYAISAPFATTGGASPCIDLMLHLITCRHGRALSERVASAFIYDPLHTGDAPQQMIATTRISSKHPRIARVLKQMENLIDSPPTIAALARANGISTRKLELEFKAAYRPGARALFSRAAPVRSAPPRHRQRTKRTRNRDSMRIYVPGQSGARLPSRIWTIDQRPAPSPLISAKDH